MKKQILLQGTGVTETGSEVAAAGGVNRYIKLHGIDYKFLVLPEAYKILREHMKKPPRQYRLYLEWTE